MFCIAAFIVLALISVFSARYRKMAGKAWACVGRRVTFRPCDTNFKEELKSRLLAHVAVRKPGMVKAAGIALEVAAFLVVALTVWSLYVSVKAGLNLYVYGTCNPANAESCSLGSEACSISTAKPSFVTSVKDFKLHTWVANEFSGFGETVANIPTRMKDWKAEEYLPKNVSYEKKFDKNKPTALDVFDPGCHFCRALYKNQQTAGFADRYNVAYIAYPIKDPAKPGQYKFRNSMVISRYLEAAKLTPLEGAKTPADWQILDRIYTGKDPSGLGWQNKINTGLNNQQTAELMQDWLREFGYSDEQVAKIRDDAGSDKVKQLIEANARIVDDRIKTVKIPTLIFDGKRYGGTVQLDELR